MQQKAAPVKIIVFDLNKTLYNKSSKDEFFKFVCSRNPSRIGKIFQMSWYKLLSKFHLINQTEFKENFFRYLDRLPPEKVEEYAAEFWKREFPSQFNVELLNHLESMRQKGFKIYCATGSYEIYVKPLFGFFPVDGLVGTRSKYENKTYCIEGEACKGLEKIRRLDELFAGAPYEIIEAYSDREEAILKKAERSFLVKKGNIIPFKIPPLS